MRDSLTTGKNGIVKTRQSEGTEWKLTGILAASLLSLLWAWDKNKELELPPTKHHSELEMITCS